MFSIDFDINFVMKKIRPSIRDCSSLRRGKIPYGGVALTQGEELKFLAGINHNTLFVFMHDMICMILIACKELHWQRPEQHLWEGIY